jgi:hypothetical protein
MKRGCLITLVVGIAAMAALYKYWYPTYSYRYRLTVNIEVDGKVHTGSSVIEVTWYAHFLPELVSFSPELRGQAALVDLGSHGVVVATLINGEDYGPARDGAWGAIWIIPRAFGIGTSVYELPAALPKLRGRRDLAPDNLPRFVWFSNLQDPTTARKVLSPDFPAVLGPFVRFAGASVEIANDSLVIDIRDKLSWLKALEQKPPGDDVIYLPNMFGISRSLFIGDAS